MPAAAANSKQLAGEIVAMTAAAAAPSTHSDTKQQQQQQQQGVSLAAQLSQLRLRYPAAAADPAAFNAWFPGLALSKTDVAQPQAVVLCFHRQGLTCTTL
jgi:hypothetical protein